METENLKKKGVIWITGYSSSGKTTIGRKVEYILRRNGLRTIFLDGDDLRSIFSNKWGYSRDERVELAKIYFRLCSHLASQGFTIIISAVAMYDDVRIWLRKHVPNSVEVYLDVPEKERMKRDKTTKLVYKRYNFPKNLYDEPKSADLTINNYGDTTPEIAAKEICNYFLVKGIRKFTDRGKNSHWEEYYRQDAAPKSPSSFAIFTSELLKQKMNMKIIDVGCGNGRDSIFFSRCGHLVTALDSSKSAISYCRRNHGDNIREYYLGTIKEYKDAMNNLFDVVYSRFCIHAMTPVEEDEFLSSSYELLKTGGKLFIECRSINDGLSKKGEILSPNERILGHYRRFIVLEELIGKIEKLGLSSEYSIESAGLAVHKEDDPVVIRVVAKKV